MQHHALLGTALISVALTMSFPNRAQQVEGAGTTSEIELVSGGVGEAEREVMKAGQTQYSFWLTTAAKRSGAFLTGVQVRVQDTQTRRYVLEHKMDGPWLFAMLPPGRYEVVLTYRETEGSPDQVIKKTTRIGIGDHRQMVVYFDTSDEVQKVQESGS